MEIDDLKRAWQDLDRRLDRVEALHARLQLDARLGTLRHGLRPLVFGQALQVVFGVAVAVVSGMFWTSHRQETAMVFIGLLMQAYGIVAIAMGAATLAGLGRIDYAAPVVAMQKRLASVRRLQVAGGLVVGGAWWVLWLPATAMIMRATLGMPLHGLPSSWLWLNVALGLAGIAAMRELQRRSQRADAPRLARRVDDVLAGRSLREAQRALDDIVRFERE
jgi:hypothetical protein